MYRLIADPQLHAQQLSILLDIGRASRPRAKAGEKGTLFLFLTVRLSIQVALGQ
jgi:hypothetical protein